MLTLTAVLNLQTKQVDYNNAFAQAPITEDVYIELPRDFENSTEGNFVLKLKTSLYGMKQSPLVWFNHLKAGLEKRGFKASASDPCLFLHQDVICLVYVDDCLFFARDQMKIDEMIQDLQKDFALEPEKDVSAFLGIEIHNHDDGRIELRQPGLIQRILAFTGMEDCHGKLTPALETPLGTDTNGPARCEEWNYASAILNAAVYGLELMSRYCVCHSPMCMIHPLC